eukprot:CAMPEP_0176460262 /NCGR_PEP_ID=MMETSP0127-20121128/33863_1 /TAXON_ID=938130 /ORGANISM="Platyophrya macrostoma, Strain WH" /LENGTH=102 /DNA_ID=CAMNT_0017851547 /DNA_START=314 /DNA_END=618 /DNA_ORIENTATION=-
MILEVTGLVTYTNQYPQFLAGAENQVDENNDSVAESVAFLRSVKGNDDTINDSFSNGGRTNSTDIDVDTDQMCAICWETLGRGQKLVYVESCKHQYHRLCIS